MTWHGWTRVIGSMPAALGALSTLQHGCTAQFYLRTLQTSPKLDRQNLLSSLIGERLGRHVASIR
jgi:hypothetical protein